MKRWYAKDTAPVEVECELRGYPHKDANGNVQYENSHYDTEAQAWASLVANMNARLSLVSDEVEEARRHLARVEKKAADAVVYAAAVTEGHRRFLARQPSSRRTSRTPAAD